MSNVFRRYGVDIFSVVSRLKVLLRPSFSGNYLAFAFSTNRKQSIIFKVPKTKCYKCKSFVVGLVCAVEPNLQID